MIQYKLIKKYPGSAPEGSIFQQNPEGSFADKDFTVKVDKITYFASLKELMMKEYFVKVNVCEMIDKLIRLTNQAYNKKNKNVYKIIDWANSTEKSYSAIAINNDKDTITISISPKYFEVVTKYFFIDSKGKVQVDFYTNQQLLEKNEHSYRLSIGNCFYSISEANNATMKAFSIKFFNFKAF